MAVGTFPFSGYFGGSNEKPPTIDILIQSEGIVGATVIERMTYKMQDLFARAISAIPSLPFCFKVSQIVNIPLTDGNLPLHAAIRSGDLDKVKNLLSQGADPKLKDFQGMTAYDYAFFAKDQLILEMLLPKNSVKAFAEAYQKSNDAFFEMQSSRKSALQVKAHLQNQINHRLAYSSDSFTGLHRELMLGGEIAFKAIEQVSFSKSKIKQNGFTLLQCALLSKDEQLIKKVISKLGAFDLLESDDSGWNALHYAAMLGLTDTLELSIKRCKGCSGFSLDSSEQMFGPNLAHLAVAANQPGTFAALCKLGANINSPFHIYNSKCNAAELLSAVVDENDPLKVSNGQYILAAFNLLSIAAENYSSDSAGALTLCSLLTNAALNTQGGFKGQLLFWGGEAFSLAVKMGLAQVPQLKACVDICRVAAVCLPCIKAIGNSLRSRNYESGKAFKCAAINSIIAGSSIYRIQDSLRYARDSLRSAYEYINIPKVEQPRVEQPRVGLTERHITFGSTYIGGNPERDRMSKMVDVNQKEYADRWGLDYQTVTESKLKNQCAVRGKSVDCSPYWNKIKVLKDWLDEPSTASKGKEEWRFMLDDDMVVTNMNIDPLAAIPQLQGNTDTSFLVASDLQPYTLSFLGFFC